MVTSLVTWPWGLVSSGSVADRREQVRKVAFVDPGDGLVEADGPCAANEISPASSARTSRRKRSDRLQ
jgi:hypothetical protein